jgi:hypothetical protein
METFTVAGPDISTAWIRACRALLEIKTHRGYHTVVRIQEPRRDDLAVRTELDRILIGKKLQPVRTVANTIFPAALAANAKTHEELVTRYKGLYPVARRLHRSNRLGTYFMRLIDYPGSAGGVDQIAAIVRQLRLQVAAKGPKTACYEANLVALSTDEAVSFAVSAPIRVPGQDNGTMDFPCLSHCSFQLDRAGRLHLAALYRSHYMVEKAYGNYVGLGDLLAYVARQSGLQSGSLTVMAGYAQLDNNVLTALQPLLTETASMVAA